MNHLIRSCLVLALLFLMSFDAAAGTVSSGGQQKSKDRVAELGAKIEEIQKKYSIVGLSVVAVKNGSVVWNTNFGLADIKREVPVTDQTKFRIASISKTVASTALMQLWERGKCDLDEDISRYLGWKIANPHHPDKPITIRHLLTHTSSLTDNANYDRFLQVTYNAGGRAPNLRELLHVDGAYYNNGASVRTNAPGTSLSYCNLAFGVVGTLVEKISGEDFQTYCAKNIFEPLHMNASFNVALLPDINELSALYKMGNNGFEAQFDDYGGVHPKDRIGRVYRPGHNALVYGPQGGLRVSVLDLSKFMVQFMDRKPFGTERILRKSTVQMMLGEQWSRGGKGKDYSGRGLGFQRTQSLVPEELWIGHTGSAYGLYSSMFFVPDKSMGVIFITNGSQPGEPVNGFYRMQREVMELLVDYMKQPSESKVPVTRR